ncbi:unnamed protein product [marine sediment metagenome]|uniref:Uncharacterized protein n=1 Tax=marine sediment metagenome TaxID=412755 RepID=X1V2M6_9ZZZZ
MGIDPLQMVAIALSCLFGIGGALVGLAVGIRTVVRDEERWRVAIESLDLTRSDMARLRLDWGATLESLEQLAQAVEKGRRRSAASEAVIAKRDQVDDAPTGPVTSADMRNHIRRQMKVARG